MVAEGERERGEFSALTVTDSPSAMTAAGTAMSVVASGIERVSDIRLMLQLFFCRHVDNFQIFLEEMLRAIYLKQPGLLKRSEPIAVEKVLVHETMDAFVDDLRENRILKIAYKSVSVLASIVKEDMKFELFPDRRTAQDVALAFDVRNLVTHNYGIMNKIFLSKHADSDLALNEPYPVLPERIADAVRVLIAAARDIETRANRKFKLDLASG